MFSNPRLSFFNSYSSDKLPHVQLSNKIIQTACCSLNKNIHHTNNNNNNNNSNNENNKLKCIQSYLHKSASVHIMGKTSSLFNTQSHSLNKTFDRCIMNKTNMNYYKRYIFHNK